jgi:hypothetical protein
MPSLSSLGKRPQGLHRNQSIRGFFGFKSSFQNCFWNVFSTSGLSRICKIRNVWKLPSLFSWNTLIPCSEKTSWSLKTSFWKKNCQINSKTVKNSLFPKLLKEGIKSVSGIFIEDYLRNLTCWEKSKN